MSVLDDLLADVAIESDRLRTTVASLDTSGWRTPTLAEGWDVATQIAHLAWTDEAAVAAARATNGDATGWETLVSRARENPARLADDEALAGAQVRPEDLLTRWDTARFALAEALRSAAGRIPWFGPSMSPASMATARFMETWAHGLDVTDALGIEPEITDRIRNVCHLGVRTRDFAYTARGLKSSTEEIRIELLAPSGVTWTYGSEGAAQRVSGPAYHFAQLVTQRIHRDDTELIVVGEDAEQWLEIAQAFAGPPGGGRPRAGASSARC
ncbi:conserved hypothetical protein [Parafrankia sp. EAN1pec]|uniref:TIGR03084 family metal-binding protein n=1 Tax=Parafrankia sp. (strain EAN1pec) TaxID=298653 RepID=UPI0000540EEB|nr:conserved hypothetical protein [Frankia sp. EAN1pec]